jgi:hypothetical protein
LLQYETALQRAHCRSGTSVVLHVAQTRASVMFDQNGVFV